MELQIHETERAIWDKESVLQDAFGLGIAATYRCRTCRSLSSLHEGRDVKGCKKRRALEDVDLLNDLNTQLDTISTVLERLDLADEKDAIIQSLRDDEKANRKMASKRFLSMEKTVKKLIQKLDEVAASRELLHSILGDLLQCAVDYDSGAITREAMKTAVEQAVVDKKLDRTNLAADIEVNISDDEDTETDKDTDKDTDRETDKETDKEDEGKGDGVGTSSSTGSRYKSTSSRDKIMEEDNRTFRSILAPIHSDDEDLSSPERGSKGDGGDGRCS